LPRPRRPKIALVDGSNAAHASEGEKARLSNIVVLRRKLKDHVKSFPEVRRRIIRYMIVAGEVVLERRTRKRNVG
jgi:hypothetical protein